MADRRKLFYHVRKRTVSDIMKKAEQSKIFGLMLGNKPFFGQAFAEKLCFGINAQSMFKTIVGSTRKNHQISPQLVNVQKPLKKRMVYYWHYFPNIHALVRRYAYEFFVEFARHICISGYYTRVKKAKPRWTRALL